MFLQAGAVEIEGVADVSEEIVEGEGELLAVEVIDSAEDEIVAARVPEFIGDLL